MRISIYNEKNVLIHKSYRTTKENAIDKAQEWIYKRKVKSVHNRVTEYRVRITDRNNVITSWNYKPTFRI